MSTDYFTNDTKLFFSTINPHAFSNTCDRPLTERKKKVPLSFTEGDWLEIIMLAYEHYKVKPFLNWYQARYDIGLILRQTRQRIRRRRWRFSKLIIFFSPNLFEHYKLNISLFVKLRDELHSPFIKLILFPQCTNPIACPTTCSWLSCLNLSLITIFYRLLPMNPIYPHSMEYHFPNFKLLFNLTL